MTVSLIKQESISESIHLIRNQRVILDLTIAKLYKVELKALSQAVKRNIKRFPADFMFELTHEEHIKLKVRNKTLRAARGQYTKYLPKAFTEEGIAMLSSVLRSDRAIEVNIEIIRAFVNFKKMTFSNEYLLQKMNGIEKTLNGHEGNFKIVFDAIKQLMLPPENPSQKIGFEA